MANRSTEDPAPRPFRQTSSGPQRTCVGCRKVADSSQLLRFANTVEGVRQGLALPGRGAWLCPDRECMNKALSRRSLARSLGVSPGAVDVEILETSFRGEPQSDLDGAIVDTRDV